ncbi:RNA-binding protein [Candidatus Pacearchaeota archaeon]|nr:RNA-binding protein [Candidatus Pacearchaeota archaeon]
MKLYVGNLGWEVKDVDLKEAFSKFGEVTEAVVIVDKYSGRSKGFGFVTFADDEAAKKAISEMNDKEIKGRAIKVNEAKPMEPRENFQRRSFGRRY